MATSEDHDPQADEHSEAPELDRTDILRRRTIFIARALGSLTVPALVFACSDPKPCLSPIAPSSTSSSPASASPTTSAPMPSASEAVPAPTSGVARIERGPYSITPADAQKLGLPALGFRVTMTKGWSISGATKDQYVQASGPPGGPLGFLAKPYDQASEKATIEALFRKVFSDWGGIDPMEVGPAETVTLGGRKLDAQSFRTGKQPGATNWCIVKAPGGASAPGGILFLFGTATNESIKPGCKRSLEHDWIAEIVTTLMFIE